MYKIYFLKDNRNDVIRTRGLFVPNEALYQAEPHLDLPSHVLRDSFYIISRISSDVNTFFKKFCHVFFKDLGRQNAALSLSMKFI